MPRSDWAPQVYPAAEQFVDRCLRSDDSLFEPGRAVWTAGVVQDAYRAFIDQPDIGDRDFISKLEDQLRDSPDETKLLMAELLYFHLLGEADTGGDVKRQRIGSILSWMQEPVEIPADLASRLDRGVANSAWAKNRRDAQVAWLLEFARQWKELTGTRREELLGDPWEFERFIHGLPKHSASIPIEATLHFVFPETFEDVFSVNVKDKIAKAFGETDKTVLLDRRLCDVRARLEGEIGPFNSFYAPEVRTRWDAPATSPQATRWDVFTDWAARIFTTAGFDEAERNYKLVVAKNVSEARDAVEADAPDWLASVKRAFGPPNNETNWRAHGAFLEWCEAHEEAARAVLAEIWSGEPDRDRLGRLLEAWEPNNSPGNRLAIVSFLLAGTDKTRYPVFRPRTDGGARRLLGLPKADTTAIPTDLGVGTPEELAAALDVPGIRVRNILRDRYPRPEGEKGARWRLTPDQVKVVVEALRPQRLEVQSNYWDRYTSFLSLLDELLSRLEAREVPIRDRLDAQGLVFWIVNNEPPESWSDGDKAAFLAWRSGQNGVIGGDEGRTAGLIPPATNDLAGRVFVDRAWLQEVLDLLEDKQQLIFYGPPGTGKTLIAQLIGDHVRNAGGFADIVQFHPSYSYEDFFEGYRPLRTDGGLGVTYAIQHGPLRRAATNALQNKDRACLLVVDEINRGNIPKIFGELLYLLEYRDRAIRLQYSPDEEFWLPENVFLIGTMNTADRSIALVDAALRRRFYFVPFMPREGPVKDVLRRWLESSGRDDLPARLIDELNTRIAKDEISIGPSYLMAGDGSEASLRRIWRYSIMPLLEEHYYGTKHEVEKEFGLDACLAAVKGASEAASGGAGADVTVVADSDTEEESE